MEALKVLLEHGADVHLPDSEGGRLSIMLAMKRSCGCCWTTKQELMHRNAKGQTALMLAARNLPSVVVILLEDGADVHSKDTDGWTPLHYACTSGNGAAVRLLLENGANIDATENHGLTPLIVAITADLAAVVKILLENGANVNPQDSGGLKPLNYACALGRSAVVEVLLEKKAHVNVQDAAGRTPLMHAIAEDRQEVVDLLMDSGADHNGETVFDFAVRTNEAAAVGILLLRYAEKVTEQEGSHTVHAILQTATYSYVAEHPPLVLSLQVQLPLGKLTLDHFQTLFELFPAASFRSRDRDGAQPLHKAVRVGTCDEVLRLVVLQHPAALRTRDYTGAWPLHTACQAAASLNTIRLLVELDAAAVHTPNNDGALPFHLLCGANCPPVNAVKYLLRRDPGFVSTKTPDGVLPFMLAYAAPTSSSSLDVLQELLTAHPDALLFMREYYSS